MFSSTEELANFVGTMSWNGASAVQNLLSQPFADIKLFDDAREKIETLANDIDLGGAFSKAKLKITANTSAVFDFGLASLGLQRLVEFYSEQLEREHPKAFESYDAVAGLVPNVLVEKNEFEQYYVVYNGTKYLLEKRQKGTTVLKRANPSIKLILMNGMLVPENHTDPDVAAYLGFTSSQKKSYIEFEKQGGKTPYIDLLVPLNFLSGYTGLDALNSLLPAIMAARFFEMAGIQTRILAGRVAGEYNGVSASPYNDSVVDYDRKIVPPPPNAQYNKTLFVTDLDLPPYYEAFPIANTAVFTILKHRGKEPDYNAIGQLLATDVGRSMVADFSYFMWDEKAAAGARNYRKNVSTGYKGLWYAYPSTMIMVGKVFGKYTNYVYKENAWGDFREMGSYLPTPFNPCPPLLSLGAWIATDEYSLADSIKDGSLLLHNHPFGYSFWMLIDRAELALSKNETKVMVRINKRLRAEGYDDNHIKDYVKYLANIVFTDTLLDPLESLKLSYPSGWPQDKAVPPQYYPIMPETQKFNYNKAQSFMKSYENMMNKFKP